MRAKNSWGYWLLVELLDGNEHFPEPFSMY